MATRMYVCESAEHPSNLLIGLNEQRLKGQLCDVTVRVQGHLFKAHTNVLASAMGYFRDVFLNPTKQVKKDIIEIPMIVNTVGFAKVLDFIYTSQLCLSQSSVMQVLCSACYLQIPYVVDKCQEFIVTHGHVSPPALGLPGGADQRYLMYHNKGSENSACELINTPPSPGNHSAANSAPGEEHHASSPVANDEPHDLSPGGSMPGKTENMENPPYGPVDPTASSDNPASRALIEFSNQTRMNFQNDPAFHTNRALKMLLQNSEGQGNDSETIDHDSLAEYFARSNAATATENYPTFGMATAEGTAQPTNAIEQHLYSMTKSISKGNTAKDLAMTGSPTSSVSQYLLSMKKEKPKKEYRCEYCSKLFGRQQHLKRHILTHTGERPYPCHLCEKRFRRSEHLKHHLAKHQQETNRATGETAGAPMPPSYNASRKRKSMPADAYSMSKLMLVSSCNQSKPEEQSPSADNNKVAERDLMGSNPILIAKLNNGGSALDSISERLAFAAAQRSEQEQDTYPANVESPMALNLSGKGYTTTSTTVIDQPISPTKDEFNGEKEKDSSLDDSLSHEKETNGSDGMMVSEKDEAAPHTDQSEHGDCNGNYVDSEPKSGPETEAEKSNANNMSMDNFASSEVVTSDLKRLFAAMDGC